ncbi:MAG TPA: cytochrome C556 [Rhodobiaceae bacterium]|nr:MAG: Cytochrome c-556 [Rhodobiaceae bacterium UBA7378]HCQ82538.1 cytochrome C556 [Rhodobiaceae bacterium]|tara:strand:+ start:942 stop:1436 length:495 start_codon:yes stop_codon:yes gene_type:complete
MRFLAIGLSMFVAVAVSISTSVSVVAHDETSNHSHDSVAPPENASIVDKRIHRFKQSGGAIQSIFKEHLGADDFGAIADAAKLIGDWAEEMPAHFPAGSESAGARAEIWADFDDFKAKAADNAMAARALQKLAMAGTDKGAIAAAAKKMGGTCKACHQSYRNKK